jgi:hypothetical protein
MMRCLGSVILVFAALYSSFALAQGPFGQFKGEVVAKFMGDGRKMRLEKPFGYIDPKGVHWDVPEGAVTDGASIPRVLWLSHPPFTGQYRSAAVIHDYFCDQKTRTWRETHEVFYNATRAAGVKEDIAKAMYAAVYYFGPRWGAGSPTRGGGALKGLTSEQEAAAFKEIQVWIRKDNPSLEAIARRLDNSG